MFDMSIFVISIIVVGGLFIGITYLVNKIKLLKDEIVLLEEKNIRILSQKKSSEVRLGQISEQLVPFLSVFKFDPKRAHFIGQPIDYVVFEDDAVIFVEVKSGGAQLTSTQKSIKKLIQDGKVRWEEIRVNGETGKEEKNAENVTDALVVDGVRQTPDVQSQTQTNIQMPGVSSTI